MKRFKSMSTLFASLFLFTIFLVGCKNEDFPVTPQDSQTTNKEALEKLVSADAVIQSFEPNYNEEQAMDFVLGKTTVAIFPVKVGQRMHLVNKDMNVTFKGDSAFATLTRTFDGTLFIAASYQPFTNRDSSTIDTVIQKPFTTTIIRNIIFEKIANNRNPMHNWRITAISLPEGGTLQENINIDKITVYYPSGDSLIITSPTDYYLSRGPGHFRQVPVFARGQNILVKVELTSAYADTDFVTLTYGAYRGGRMHRSKKLFQLVSSQQTNGEYLKVYEQSWRTHMQAGWKHAIINVIPKQVLYDDSAPVEENSWGIPYKVRK